MKKYHELLEEHYNKTTLTSDEEFELCKAFCRYHGFTDSEIEFYIPSNEILNWNSSLEQELENNNVVINDVKDIIIDNFINKFIDDVEEDLKTKKAAEEYKRKSGFSSFNAELNFFDYNERRKSIS